LRGRLSGSSGSCLQLAQGVAQLLADVDFSWRLVLVLAEIEFLTAELEIIVMTRGTVFRMLSWRWMAASKAAILSRTAAQLASCWKKVIASGRQVQTALAPAINLAWQSDEMSLASAQVLKASHGASLTLMRVGKAGLIAFQAHTKS